MSVENPKPNLKTREEVLQYLKSKNLLRGEVAAADKAIEALLKTAQEFKPENPVIALKLYYEIGRTGLKINRNQQDRLFQELTGCEIKDIIEMGAREAEIIEAEPVVARHEVTEEHTDEVVVENEGRVPATRTRDDRSILDKVADADLISLTVNTMKISGKSYRGIKKELNIENCRLAKILAYTGVMGVGLTTLIGGTGLVLAARTLRLAGKVLKAAKGTAALHVQKNALKNMEKTKNGIEAEQQQLAELSETQRSELDTFVLDNGLETEKGVKAIQALREEKILPKDAERIILEEYGEVSLLRDISLTRIINSDTLEMFEQAYGIDQDKMAEFISKISIGEDGELEFPEDSDIDVSKFDEAARNSLNAAVYDESLVMGAQESSKLAVSDYIEFKDGAIAVKEGVDLRTLPKEVGRIVVRMQNKRVPEDLFDQVILDNNCITALIMCEEEILTNTAIEANREMSEIYADRGEIVTDEKKGVIRSSVEAITAASLHARAKAIVEKRVESHIFDAVTRNGGASERLLALAREKLIENTQEAQRGDNTQTLDENGQPIVDTERE